MCKCLKFISIIIVTFFLFSGTYSYTQDSIITEVKSVKVSNSIFVDEIKINGSVQANESVKITSVVQEKIKNIKFKEGSIVSKGSVLVELFNDEEMAVLKQAKAEFEESVLNYERTQKLTKEGNASQALLDKRLKEKKKLEGKVEEILAQIRDLTISAPFDGVISTKNFSEGSFVKPGDIIANLYDIDSVKIEVFVPEKYSNIINKDRNITVNSLGNNGRNFSGYVYAIDPYIDTETRTFRLIGLIENNEDYILKPGMMVNVKIVLDSRKALSVPEGSIVPESNDTFVYIINKNSKAIKTKVKTGKRKDGLIEITNGITEDSLVIYEGTNKIKSGSKVKSIQ